MPGNRCERFPGCCDASIFRASKVTSEDGRSFFVREGSAVSDAFGLRTISFSLNLTVWVLEFPNIMNGISDLYLTIPLI